MTDPSPQAAAPAVHPIDAAAAARTQQIATDNRQQQNLDQDETYDREQKKYKRWVDAQIELGRLRLDDQGRYLTTYNIKLYFHEVIVFRMLNSNSVGHVSSALQKLANEREYAGSRTPFL